MSELPPLIYPSQDLAGLERSVLTIIDALLAQQLSVDALEVAVVTESEITTRDGAAPMSWLGVWSASLEYLRGDAVTHTDQLWAANKTTTETPSGGASDWDLMADSVP